MNKRAKIERGGDGRIRKRVRRRGSTSTNIIVDIRNVHGGRRGLVLGPRMDTHLTPRQNHIPLKILEGVVIIEEMKTELLLAVVMMIMIGTTSHLIEGGIDMMIVMTAGGRGGARVEIETDG